MVACGFIDLLGSVVETFLGWNVLISWTKPVCQWIWQIPVSPMLLHACISYHVCRWNNQSFHIRLYRSGGKYSVANFRSATFSSVEVRSDIAFQGYYYVNSNNTVILFVCRYSEYIAIISFRSMTRFREQTLKFWLFWYSTAQSLNSSR